MPSITVALHHQALALHQECTRCQACVTHCAFLRNNGAPGDIAASLQAGDSTVDPFECSLCNLCTAVCPAPIAPGTFFLEMRRQVVARYQLPASRYTKIIRYERRGSSRLFSWYGLPTGCDTVFFPGCTLPAPDPRPPGSSISNSRNRSRTSAWSWTAVINPPMIWDGSIFS